MFKAVSRYFRALGYMVTGRIDAARRTLSTNPHVVNATYDNVIEEKRKSIQQFKDAIARLIVQHENKMGKIKAETDEVNRLEQLKEGAAAKARTVIGELKTSGVGMETIKSNEDYQKCLVAFNGFTAKIEEKGNRIVELEQEVTEMDESIKGHKIQLQQMLQDIETLREEQATAVAEMITAKEEQEINDMLAGISQDRTSRELADMRQLRDEMKAKARVSKELAGSDTKAQEAEFLDYAQKSLANDEFDRLIGLAGESDRENGDSPDGGGAKLPE